MESWLFPVVAGFVQFLVMSAACNSGSDDGVGWYQPQQQQQQQQQCSCRTLARDATHAITFTFISAGRCPTTKRDGMSRYRETRRPSGHTDRSNDDYICSCHRTIRCRWPSAHEESLSAERPTNIKHTAKARKFFRCNFEPYCLRLIIVPKQVVTVSRLNP